MRAHLIRTRLVAAALIACGSLAVVPAAAAADDQVVLFFGCAANDGETTVAADEPIIIRFGWGARTKGLVIDFLKAAEVTVMLDDQELANADSYWGSPEPPDPDLDFWTAWWTKDVGTLSSGESMDVSVDIYVSHRLHDGYSYDEARHPTMFGPGSLFSEPPTCLITAE